MPNDVVLILCVVGGAFVTFAALWPLRLFERRFRLQAEESLRLAQQQLERVELDALQLGEMLNALLDAYPHPVFLTTSDRVIQFANPAALELVRLPRELVVGRILATVVQDYDSTRLLIEATKSGHTMEHVALRPATGQTWRVAVTPLTLTGAVGSASGVTHLVLAVEDLTELKRLETIRRDFVAHVSHELRTPLAAVKLLAETLQDAMGDDPEAAQSFAKRIVDETDHLTQLVAELLELSRIESGRIQLHQEPTDIQVLVESVVERLRPLAEERSIRLVSAIGDALPDAWADASRVSEVLINLIHNGLKYTPAGGRVTISALIGHERSGAPSTSSPDAEPMVVVHVEDTGMGIGEEDLPRVFERFFKVDRARTRQPYAAPAVSDDDAPSQAQAAAGTGLGLAIAKHLVELQGGSIWAESRLGRGSTFSFSLPLVPAGAGRATPETDDEHESSDLAVPTSPADSAAR